MKLNHKTTINTSARHGFSLIELMIVIAIIAILMAIILPAISRVRDRAAVTGVATEITQLDQAIATFKNQFQIEPPSSLFIPGQGGAWTNKDMAVVRTIWPQFSFATSPPSGSMPGDANYLWNGGLNNLVDLRLNGAECLVFFLGGVESGSPGKGSLSGFSKNPLFPWTLAGSNRVGPFFEFDSGRLTDVDDDPGDTLLFEYRDNLTDQATPYLYLSSQGKLYNKINTGGFDDFDVFGGPKDLSLVYLKADGSTPQRANSYQIISPGLDGAYGFGGVYTDGSELIDRDLNANSTLEPNELRGIEADNITNFSSGTLKP